jgi:hypothetical protein
LSTTKKGTFLLGEVTTTSNCVIEKLKSLKWNDSPEVVGSNNSGSIIMDGTKNILPNTCPPIGQLYHPRSRDKKAVPEPKSGK